jgi:hypothetical protein
VALLESEHALRLHAEGLDLKTGAGREKRVPDIGRVLEWNMNLVPELPDEAHAHDPAWRARYLCLANAEIRKSLTGKIELCVLAQDRS